MKNLNICDLGNTYLKYFQIMIHNKYFTFFCENPLKTYNKAKKYFRKIKTRFKINFCKTNRSKIIDFTSFDIIWKDKYDSPRHELNPRIQLSLFNYIHFTLEFILSKYDLENMVCWESMLNWLFYNKNLQESINISSGWTQHNSETNKEEYIDFVILKPEFQIKYNNNELEHIFYESKT